MNEGSNSLSGAHSYQELGEFWDAHDLAEHWDQTQPAEFEFLGGANIIYYPVEAGLSAKLLSIARQRGVPARDLLNRWLEEKVEDATGA